MNNATFYILIDQIKILDANAISGPLSYGFPSINSILGASHALQRKLDKSDFPEIRFDGVLISCSEYTPKVDSSGYDISFIQKRAPLKKDGKTASIVEEGYVDLTLSLVIKAIGDPSDFLNFETRKKELEARLKEFCLSQRLAGGTVISIDSISFYRNDQEDILKKRLLPGYVLINASEEAQNIYHEMVEGYRTEIEEKIDESTDEITNRVINPLGSNANTNALDVLLNTAIIHQIAPSTETEEWQKYSFKTGRGWLVPIPIGYQAISPLYEAGTMKNTRNPEYPAQFVETIYALGKWVFPHRLRGDLKQYFWRYAKPENNLYLIEPTE